MLCFAREHNVTKIVVGKPQPSRWRDEMFRGAFVYELIRRCGDIDVYVISGDTDQPSSIRKPAVNYTPQPWLHYVWASRGHRNLSRWCVSDWRSYLPQSIW